VVDGQTGRGHRGVRHRSPGYDEHGYPSDTQREWVVRLLQRLPPDSIVLDAPCVAQGNTFQLWSPRATAS